MVHTAILEDNPVHRDRLQKLLEDIYGNAFSVSVFSSGEEFIRTLRSFNPQFDIAFIDIELGQDSGIKVSEQANTVCPRMQIIYTSQYLDYVSPVYDTVHTYFIYKPELETYLQPAVEKALRTLKKIDERILTVSWNREDFHICEKDIIYMERTLRTTTIYTASSQFLTSKKLSDIITDLSENFVMCQRSFIVNLEYVSAYHTSQLFLSNGKTVPVSRSHFKKVRERVEQFLFQ